MDKKINKDLKPIKITDREIDPTINFVGIWWNDLPKNYWTPQNKTIEDYTKE